MLGKENRFIWTHDTFYYKSAERWVEDDFQTGFMAGANEVVNNEFYYKHIAIARFSHYQFVLTKKRCETVLNGRKELQLIK